MKLEEGATIHINLDPRFPTSDVETIASRVAASNSLVPGYIPPVVGLTSLEAFFFAELIDETSTVILVDQQNRDGAACGRQSHGGPADRTLGRRLDRRPQGDAILDGSIFDLSDAEGPEFVLNFVQRAFDHDAIDANPIDISLDRLENGSIDRELCSVLLNYLVEEDLNFEYKMIKRNGYEKPEEYDGLDGRTYTTRLIYFFDILEISPQINLFYTDEEIDEIVERANIKR